MLSTPPVTPVPVSIKGDDHNWSYGWKVVVADIAGAVFAALLFMALKGVAL